MRTLKFFLLICCIIHISFVKAQDYDIEIKDFKEDIANTNIIDFEIDNEKNLWICNANELIKYDGANTINFKLDFNYQTIEETLLIENDLFILFSNGNLSLFNIQTYSYTELEQQNVLAMCSYNNHLYLLKPGYVIEKYNLKNLEIPIKKIKIGKGFNFIKNLDHQIFVNNDGIFLSIPTRGIYVIKNHHYYPLITGDRINNSERRIEKFKIINNELYYLGLRFIKKYDKKKNRFIIDKNYKSINNKIITELLHDKEMILYINYDTNEIRIKEKGKNILNIETIEPYKIAKIDNYYIASSRKGLYIIRKKDNLIKNINLTPLEKLMVKRKIFEKESEIFFFGYPYVFSLNNKQNLTKYEFSDKPPVIYDCTYTPFGWFAVTQGNGIVKLHNNFKKNEAINLNDKNEQTMLCIFYDNHTKKIYCGSQKYIYIINPKNENQYERLPLKFTKPILDLERVKFTNKIIIATESGTYIYNEENKKLETLISKIKTSDIFIDYENKKIWLAHDKGVFIIDMNNHKNIINREFKRLKNPITTAILQDNYKNIWVSTYSGIVQISPDLKNELIYTTENGLLNQEFNYKSAVKLKNGQLIFGGISGFDLITPDNKKIAKRKVIVKDILLIGKDTLASKYNNQKISYSIDKYFCRINISSNFFNDKKISYKYKIDDGNWIKVEDRNSIDLIGFAEGNYNITIAGIDNKGTIAKEAVVNICAKEIFYKSRIFLFLALMSFFALVLFLIYFVNKKKNVRRETIEEISMDLHDEVGTLLTKTRLLFELGDKQDESNDKKY